MSRRIYHVDRVRALMRHAMVNGARRTSAVRVRWDLYGSCEAPYMTEIYGRPREEGEKFVTVSRQANWPATLELWTRCRKCAPCLKARSSMWHHRAKTETRDAVRTWFGTLTLAPEHQFMMRSRASAKWGVGFDDLPPEKQFRLITDQVGKELTLTVKRIRKNSAAPLRYLLVCEAHKTGLPHYHCLLHERSPERPVKHKVLEAAWVLGFSKWRLIKDHTEAGYVTKYLAKDARARVRASRCYGQLDLVNLGSQS